jgi:signal recognition particle subunit SRP54
MMRIARGSGRLVREVLELMEVYKRFAKAFSKLSQSRNPQDMVKSLPPHLLKPFGGVKEFQNMMKKKIGTTNDMMGMLGGGI